MAEVSYEFIAKFPPSTLSALGADAVDDLISFLSGNLHGLVLAIDTTTDELSVIAQAAGPLGGIGTFMAGLLVLADRDALPPYRTVTIRVLEGDEDPLSLDIEDAVA